MLLLIALACGVAMGCDRRTEAYDPNERPSEPDLSKIFPAGSQRVSEAPSAMPPPPGAAPGPGMAPGPGTAPSRGSNAAPVSGTVRLGDAVRDKVPSGATLFVIARTGPGPPLAVRRIASPTFPLSFSLGPEDRMIQQMPFVGPIQLSARLDADGNAMSRDAGDLQGASQDVYQPGASGIELVIDEVMSGE